MFDSLAFTERLIDSGVPPREAKAIASELMNVLRDVDTIYGSEVATKTELKHTAVEHTAKLEASRTEITSGLDTQKINLEKLRTELRYEIDKVTSSQKLDLNLERGRTRDELQKQNDKILGIDSRLDREAHLIRTQIEASKNDLLRYSVGTITALGALALGALRLMI
jgi:hypothetical protein